MRGKIGKPNLGLISACLVLIILFALVIRSNILTIKSVDIQTQNVSCTDSSQIKNLSKLLGQNFFLVSSDPIQENLKKKFICIKNINLSKSFPNKVKLEVFGREPVALLLNLKEATVSALVENIATPSAEQAADRYLIDTEGMVFSKDLDSQTLPEIYLLKPNLSLGPADDSILIVLKILEKVKTFGLNVGDSLILNNFLVIFPEISQPKIIFRLDNLDSQIASLQLILKIAKIDASQLEFIDLRFDKPIVRIAPKKK